MGMETVSPISIDPLGWHIAIVLIATGIGYTLTNWIGNITGLSVPSFSVGFLVAILFSLFFSKTKINHYIDNKIISRIGGTATDFLVFFGVASIKIPILIKYALPFSLLMLFGIAWIIFHFWFIAPRLLGKDWFEKGIYIYGYSSGVTAIGLALLRVADPENKSSTLDDTAVVTPIESIIEIFALAIAPGLVVSGNWIGVMCVIVLYLVTLIIIPTIMKWWTRKPNKVSAANFQQTNNAS